jgi:hypothetical protein
MRFKKFLSSSSKYSSLVSKVLILNVWKYFHFYFSIVSNVDLFVKVLSSSLDVVFEMQLWYFE